MRENLSEILLVAEFTEEFAMGYNTPGAGSVSNGPQNAPSQNTFPYTQFNEPPIRDAGMAAEISKFIKSQILYHANTAVYAQAVALNPSALSLMQDFG